MIKLKKVLIFIIFFSSFSLQCKGYENKILFKVENEIITSIDLLNEIEYRKLLNNRLNELPQQKLFEIAKKFLIREKIKKIANSKFFIDYEIDEKNKNLILNDFIKKTNFETKDDFLNFLKYKNIKIETFLEKMKIEIIWNQMIVTKFSNNIKIDKIKIKEDIIENNVQKNYLLSEIVFNLDNENLDQKFNKIKEEIYSNGFENTASTYSISESAKEGGKLGWIKFNSLSENIKKEILLINKNEFTKPILIPSGFLILKIDDEKNINIVENIDSEVENISRAIANKQLNQFSNIYFNKIKKDFNINEL